MVLKDLVIAPPETGWAIKGKRGLYVGWWLLRKDAVNYHCKNLGHNWRKCKARGDRAVRVTITENP